MFPAFTFLHRLRLRPKKSYRLWPAPVPQQFGTSPISGSRSGPAARVYLCTYRYLSWDGSSLFLNIFHLYIFYLLYMLPVPCSVSVCLTFTRIRCHLLVVLDFTHLCSSCPPRRLSASVCSWRPSSGSPWTTPPCSSLLQPSSSSLQYTVNYGLTIYCVVVSVSQGCGSGSAWIRIHFYS